MASYVELLPSSWFSITHPSCPSVMMAVQREQWEKNNPVVVHYDRPIDPRVASFLSLDNKSKLNFLRAYDVSGGNPYFYSGIFGPPKPKTYTYIDQLNEQASTKVLYEALQAEVQKEDEQKEEKEEKDEKKRPKKKTIPKTVKNSVWIKYIGKEIGTTKCIVCKKNDISQLDFECGHVVAEANGGKVEVDNLRPICGMCNKSMATMNMDEFAQKYFS